MEQNNRETMPRMCLPLSMDGFASKPKGAAVGRMRKRFKLYCGTVEDVARMITSGHAFMPSVHARGEVSGASFLRQEVLALDFDNVKGGEGPVVSMHGALERAWARGLRPALIYETYSSKPGRWKFRMLFLLDFAISDPRLAAEAQARLMGLYPECDPACKDLARMFYGTAGRKHKYVEATAVTAFEAVMALPLPEWAREVEPERPKPAKTATGRGHARNLELEEIKRDADLVGMARALTDKRTFESGGAVYFPGRCPVCGHNDCFRVYKDRNVWKCYSASNVTGYDGGSAIDFVMAVNGLPNDSEGFKEAVSLLKQGMAVGEDDVSRV